MTEPIPNDSVNRPKIIASYRKTIKWAELIDKKKLIIDSLNTVIADYKKREAELRETMQEMDETMKDGYDLVLSLQNYIAERDSRIVALQCERENQWRIKKFWIFKPKQRTTK